MAGLFEACRPAFHRLATDGLSVGGYFPVGSEQAVGAPEPDPKAYFEFVPGRHLTDPLMSTVADVYDRLLSVLSGQAAVIVRWIAPMFAQQLPALLERAPPPILRVTHYLSDRGRKIANYPHSDINLVTLLPRATVPGLQVLTDSGWQEIHIDEDSILVLVGDMLELMGGPAADVHRVIGDKERLSASLFVNASADERLPDGRLAGVVFEERLNMVRRVRGDRL
jgi:hypothetical protein